MFRFLFPSMTLNWISLGFEQSETSENAVSGFGKHWSAFFRILYQPQNSEVQTSLCLQRPLETTNLLRRSRDVSEGGWIINMWPIMLFKHIWTESFCFCPALSSVTSGYPSNARARWDYGVRNIIFAYFVAMFKIPSLVATNMAWNCPEVSLKASSGLTLTNVEAQSVTVVALLPACSSVAPPASPPPLAVIVRL